VGVVSHDVQTAHVERRLALARGPHDVDLIPIFEDVGAVELAARFLGLGLLGELDIGETAQLLSIMVLG